ncbi:hypothetical protein PABG_05043 [Paracoccidioides brasiliensis Pb03]|nr:hypothetical protein PABG_05043 [Paracoccidioides brasiliensis Pb03]
MRPRVQVIISNNNDYEHHNTHDRYSYLHTPAELHAPTFPKQNPSQRIPSVPANAAEPPFPTPLDHRTHSRPFSYIPSVMHHDILEKPTSSHPHTQSAPPLSEHPAHFAPYADNIENATPNVQSQPRISPFPQPPPNVVLFPTRGQFLIKSPSAAHEQEGRENEFIIGPDNNPLESHTTSPAYNPRSITPAFRVGHITIPNNHDLGHVTGHVTHPNQGLRGDTWVHGLCDCSDFGTCCLGIFCPCILYGRTQYRLNRKSDLKDPTNLLGYETCNASCTAMALLCGCQWLMATIQHSRTRRAYAIPGSIPSDCVRATCCTCCTLIQDEKEIKVREESARQMVLTPYLPPSHMTFSPPPR